MPNTIESTLFLNADAHELDLLNRADYATDDAYFEAVADLRMKRSSPEFQKALREVRAEQTRRERDLQSQEQAKRLEELRQSVNPSAYDLGLIQKRAQEDAAEMLSFGKIKSDQLTSKISQLEEQYTDDFKRTKASYTLLNEAVRSGARAGKTTLL